MDTNIEKSYKGCWWSLLLGAAVMVMMREYYKPEVETTVVYDTVWKDTTIYQPLPAETVKTDRVVYIKVPVGGSHGDRLTECSTTQVPVPVTATPVTVPDSTVVALPIVQKRYEDSLYTAWVSGYEPALDSINLRMPTVVETITKTVIKPAPLITFGIQMGAGYGFVNRQPDIFIGIGGQINLWSK